MEATQRDDEPRSLPPDVEGTYCRESSCGYASRAQCGNTAPGSFYTFEGQMLAMAEADDNDLDAECRAYVAARMRRIGEHTRRLLTEFPELVEQYRFMAALQFWRAKAKGKPLPDLD